MVSGYIKWNDADFTWGDNPYTWGDVRLIEEAVEAANGGFFDDWIQRHPEKKKRLVKLICKVQGKTIVETAEILDAKVTVKDVDMLVKEVFKNIKLIGD